MSRIVATIIEVATGRLISRYDGDADQLAANTPAGCIAREGAWDLLSYRYDEAIDDVVDWRPPQPSAFPFWDGVTRRWELDPLVESKRAKRQEAIAALEAIDRKTIRAYREFATAPNKRGTDGKLPRERLDAYEAEADLQRQIFSDNADPTP